MNSLRNSIRQLFQAGQARCRRRLAARPSLELLEQREVLSTLVLPQTNPPEFNATFNIMENGQPIQVDNPVSGGNFLGTLNGTALKNSYCVNIDDTIFPGSTYADASVTTNGTTYGVAVPHAGAIAWLLTHFGPTATTPIKQDALQAAIWQVEYGNTFQLDPASGPPSTNSEMAPIFQADLAALGNSTAPVGNVLWISPGAESRLHARAGPGGLLRQHGHPNNQDHPAVLGANRNLRPGGHPDGHGIGDQRAWHSLGIGGVPGERRESRDSHAERRPGHVCRQGP